MSSPLFGALKDLRRKIEISFRNLPWPMDPRTQRSLGLWVQRLIASRSSRLSRWAVSAKNRLKKPRYELKRFSRRWANVRIARDQLAEQRIRRFRSRIKQDTPIAGAFSSREWP